MSLSFRIKSQTIGCYWLSLGSVPLAEFAVEAGAEAVVFDGQHGLWDRMSLENAIGLIQDRTIPLVRVAQCDRFHIGSALDAGARGVIVPLIETAEQARQAIEWSKFPPYGSRSGGGVRPLKDFKAYQKKSDETTFVALMIETVKGYENLEDILAVENFDMIFIGTGDLSISFGASMEDPTVTNAVDHIKEVCDKSNVSVGIFTGNLAQAKMYRDRGYRLVVIGDDITTNRKIMNESIKSFS